jgi:ABC-2 type transport system permease protein
MRILHIALCDLRRVMKDKQLLFWMLILPLLFIWFIGALNRDRSNQTTSIPVVNLDSQDLSVIFVDQLKADGYQVGLQPATREAEVRNWSRALIIPATFSEDILAGKRVKLTFTKSNRSPEHTLSAQARLIHAIVRFTGGLAAIAAIDTEWNEEAKKKLLDKLAQPQLLSVERSGHGPLRPPPFGFALSLPGYLVMFVMMNGIMVGGNTLATDRLRKQLSRLSAAPVSPLEIIGGKLIGKMIPPLAQAALLLVSGHFLFGVSFGDHPMALVPVIVCFAVFTGALGMLFGVFCSTEQQITSLGILVTLALCALGGCWWSIELIPESMKTVAAFTPTYWGLQGLHDVISFGKTFADVVPECLALLAFGSVLIALSVAFLRKAV